jgi:hypothetical protein
MDGKDVEKPREIRSIRRDIIKERNRNTIGESSSKTRRVSDTGFKGGRSRKKRKSKKSRRMKKGTKRIRK